MDDSRPRVANYGRCSVGGRDLPNRWCNSSNKSGIKTCSIINAFNLLFLISQYSNSFSFNLHLQVAFVSVIVLLLILLYFDILIFFGPNDFHLRFLLGLLD